MKIITLTLTLIFASAVLTGCGNKGPLLTPTEAIEAEKTKKKY